MPGTEMAEETNTLKDSVLTSSCLFVCWAYWVFLLWLPQQLISHPLGCELRRPSHNPVSKPSHPKKSLRQMGERQRFGARHALKRSLHQRPQDRLGTAFTGAVCLP